VRVIELGCGRRKAKDAIGLDINARSDADVLCDLSANFLPLQDSCCDKVLCFDVLEHIPDFIHAVEEIWRVSKPGAVVEISCPFMSSVNYFSDPTHVRAFTSRSFDYFIEGTSAFSYAYSDARFQILSVEYDKGQMNERKGIHAWLLKWANHNKQKYEDRYAFIYPVYQIDFVLKVVK
jgi:SAM-dependent methyltransferase